jgi:hypothetical protein
MYFNEITYVLHDLLSSFLTERKPYITKIMQGNNSYYYVNFLISHKTDYNPEIMEGSQDTLISKRFSDYANIILQEEKIGGKLEFIYNFSDNNSYLITVLFNKFIKDNEFIYPNEKQQKDIESNSEQIKLEQKKINEIKWKRKLYNIIITKNEMDLSEIITKTRGIKNPEDRKKYLKDLIDDSKIKMKIDTSYGRKKRIYSAI